MDPQGHTPDTAPLYSPSRKRTDRGTGHAHNSVPPSRPAVPKLSRGARLYRLQPIEQRDVRWEAPPPRPIGRGLAGADHRFLGEAAKDEAARDRALQVGATTPMHRRCLIRDSICKVRYR